jgi:hypothetical protein
MGFEIGFDEIRRAVKAKSLTGQRCSSGRIKLKVDKPSFLVWLQERNKPVNRRTNQADSDEPPKDERAAIEALKASASREKKRRLSLD